VLVVGGETAIRATQGPPIRPRAGVLRACGDDRLESDHQTLREARPLSRVVVVADARFLVDAAPDPMPAEVPEDLEAMSLDLRLHLAADHREPLSRTSCSRRTPEGGFRTVQQPLRYIRDGRHAYRYRRVGVVALHLDGDVERDDVALSELA
jgi:hypothetical protein